jgi:hypothetical protein
MNCLLELSFTIYRIIFRFRASPYPFESVFLSGVWNVEEEKKGCSELVEDCVDFVPKATILRGWT